MTTSTGVLSGTLKDAEGKTLAGVEVSARADAGSDEVKATGKTDERGRYRLEGLTLREGYVIGVGPRTKRFDSTRLVLRRKQQTQDIDLPGGIEVTATTDTSGTVGTTTEGDPFEDLLTLIEDPALAPEPQVSIDEAREMARLFVIGMYELADVPAAIARVQANEDPDLRTGGLSFSTLTSVKNLTEPIVKRRNDSLYTEEQLRQRLRVSFNLGTSAADSVNADFGALYRQFIALAADDRNAVDPDEVMKDDVREAASIRNYLRDLKRSLMRLTQNMSVYGTLGTRELTTAWTQDMTDSIAVLRTIGEEHVISSDQDDKAPWSVLAALTGRPRENVKAYVVNGRDGGFLIRLSIAIYEAIQTGKVPDSAGLDDESDKALRSMFFSKGGDILSEQSGLKNKIGETQISTAMKGPATLVRDFVAPIWP